MSRTFGDALRSAREAAGLNQVELAKRMRLSEKSGQSNIAALENRQFPPKRKTVLRVAHAIPCDVFDLLDDVMTPWGLVLTRPKQEAVMAPKGRDHPSGQRSARR